MDVFGFFCIEVFLLAGSVGKDFSHSPVYLIEGDNGNLLCNTTVRAPVYWNYKPRDYKDHSTYICMGSHGVVPRYRQRFMVDSETYALTVHNATISDSGLYTCVDNYGQGHAHTTWMTVGKRNVSMEFENTTSSSVERSSMPESKPALNNGMSGVTRNVIIGVLVLGLLAFCVFCGHLKMMYRKVRDRFQNQESHGRRSDEHIAISIPLLADTTNRGQPFEIDLPEQDHNTDQSEPLSGRRSDHGQQSEIDLPEQDHNTDQSEPLNGVILLNDAPPSALCEASRPTYSQRQHIAFNASQQAGLAELIDANESFLADLVNAGCITQAQKDHISSVPELRQRKWELLDTSKYWTAANVKTFVLCFLPHHQKHLRRLLAETGVIVNVYATLDETSVNDVDQTERQMVSTSQQTMLAGVDEQTNAEFVPMRKAVKENASEFGVDVDLVVLMVQRIIRCYFFCLIWPVHHLFVLYGNQQLRQILESIFNISLRTDQRVHIKRLLWMINYYQQCAQYFTRPSRHDGSTGVRQIALAAHGFTSLKTFIYSRQEHRQRKSPSHRCMSSRVLVYRRQEIRQDIHSLPLELHEMMLMSSLYRLTMTLLPIDARADPQQKIKVETRAHAIAFKTLSSVCQHFHQVITKRDWFRRHLKTHLNAACRPFRLQPRLLQTLGTGLSGLVTGLTKLANRLYIVYNKSDTLNVYNSEQQPFTHIRSIHVNGMKNPTDMAASVNSNCLYVADKGSRCVWRVRADHKVDKWIDVVDAAGLSVTSEGHLVILTATDVQGSGVSQTCRGRVEVYGVNKLKLTDLILPCYVANPQHVEQTADKSFIACHGSGWTELNRVVEVNNEGSIVRSHGGPRGNGMGQLDMPCYIALDADERVFVADTRNNRISLLNRKLNIERVLLTWSRADDVYCPTRLHYDTETSQLAVGLGTGHVEIYNL